MSIGSVYKPGEVVPESGIYTVVHDRTHTAPHDVTCVRGHRFPPCRNCGSQVRFRAKYLAKHISDHELF